MKSSAALLVLAAATGFTNAQNATSPAAAAASLLAQLQQAGFNSLAKTAGQVANTTAGQSLFASILAGGPLTLFAPNDHAFTGVPSNITSKPELVAEILSYHVIPGTVNSSSFSNISNTIGLTLLNATDQVFLGPNQHQALALRTEGDGKTRVLNQNTPVTILNSTTLGNITLHTIDAVIDLPGPLTKLVGSSSNNLSSFLQAATLAGVFNTLDTTHGLTIFAPNNAAFATALQQLGANATNQTLVADVLLNHVINGSTVYSTQLSGAKATSAGGQSFTFSVNAQNSTVTSGNVTAKIISADNILWNGVVHIIDTVLINPANDLGAASSAFQSATSAAATATAPPTGPIGSPAPSQSGAGGSGGNGGSAGVMVTVDWRMLSAVLMGVLGGALVL